MTLPFLPRRAMLICAFALTPLAAPALADDITVFAAASLKNALDAIAADWQAQTGDTLAISYAGSSGLAKQIQQGAPADIFISAAVNWMDVLEADGLLKPDSRTDLLGNTLVLLAHGADVAPVVIDANLDLLGLLGGDKLAMAMVDSVPAGQYGKEALTHLGLWESVAPQVAQAENVRAALALVSTGEAPFGIVYATDAVADANAGNTSTIIGTFPADSHRPIIYPAALIAGKDKPAAAAFFAALTTPNAKSTFEKQGFSVLVP
ncbi:molybdate ABC transporter substrate-binding protein [Phaeovulum sp.]|uniref:molybdate ABC transporter substrate-binding protein n=1 Tax=Phaeovulum sp. TaxID=2934796 RepID=UPI0039E6EE2E